jgi:predicted SAM-dependent methyltransferase
MKIIISPENKTYLNIGCGGTYFPEWNNCDLLPRQHIASIDLRKPLPYLDSTFDAVYSSHVLEHFRPKEAKKMIREIFRVLKPNGVCRIVTPDLESICRLYLQYLDDASTNPDRVNLNRYRWMLIELIDQMVREEQGGLMRKVLQTGDFDVELINNRLGDNFPGHQRSDTGQPLNLNRSDITGLQKNNKENWSTKIERRLIKWRLMFSYHSADPRFSGEAHKWMYDRLSLSQLMQEIGFIDCSITNYNQSNIPYWDKYNLDVSRFGQRPRKPDSLYMEGLKP